MGGGVAYGQTLLPDLLHIKKIRLFKLEQSWIVFVELFQNIRHDEISHELGFVPDLVLFAIEIYRLLLSLVK